MNPTEADIGGGPIPVFTRFLPLTGDTCNDYLQTDPVTLSSGTAIARVRPKDYVEIEFDIDIESLCYNPSDGWSSAAICGVLQIGGNSDPFGERYPVIFIANEPMGDSQNYWYSRLTTGFDSDKCCGQGIGFNMDGDESLTAVGMHHVYIRITPDSYSVTIDNMERMIAFMDDRDVPNERLNVYIPTQNERAADAVISNVCIRSSQSNLYGM